MDVVDRYDGNDQRSATLLLGSTILVMLAV